MYLPVPGFDFMRYPISHNGRYAAVPKMPLSDDLVYPNSVL